MDNHIENIEQDNIALEGNKIEDQVVAEEQLAVSDILLKMDEIRNDLKYLDQVIVQVKDSDTAKNAILREIVTCRETTYQKMMEFYTKVYDSIKPKSAADKKKEFISYILRSIDPGPDTVVDFAEVISELAKIEL